METASERRTRQVQVFARWALRRLSPSPPAQRRIAGYVLNARSMDRNPAPCEGSASFAVTMVRGRAGLTSTSNLAASGEPSRARIRLTSCHLLSSRRTSRLHTPYTPTTARHAAWSTPSCPALSSCYIRRGHLQAEPINAACEACLNSCRASWTQNYSPFCGRRRAHIGAGGAAHHTS